MFIYFYILYVLDVITVQAIAGDAVNYKHKT